jgi:predicted DNA-binding transcriptional regulator YafY
MKTSRLSRVIQLLTVLQSGRSYTAADLAEVLKISKRMIFRDLNELRKIGVPFAFDNKANCYRMDPQFFFSPPNLDAREALGLLLLTYKARNHIHLPFKDSALSAALKIESDLPEKTRRFCNSAIERISIKVDPQERLELLDQKFTQFLDAILKRRIVTFTYESPVEREDRIIDLQPYHLMYNNYAWHVLGKAGQQVNVFKLNHIRELSVLDRHFIEDEKFDLSEHLGRAWSMVPEGRLYSVKLRFMPEVAHNVADVQWHSTQTVDFQDDGSAIVEFRVDGLNEITWWVLSYGDKVQIVSPSALRQKVLDIAQNIVKQNNRLQPA